MRWLAQQRTYRRLTQAEVARQMGVSQPYVAKLEKGAGDPRLSTVLRYALIVLGGTAIALLVKALLDTSTAPGPRPPAPPAT